MIPTQLALAVAHKILSDLLTPSDFRKDWYGWATNQLAHTIAGIVLTSVVSYINVLHLGEFAEKLQLFMVVAAFFIATQANSFIKKPFDTIEDLVFILGYGSGTVILLFHELEQGSPIIYGNIQYITPVIILASAHLLCGSVIRAARELYDD